MCLLLLVYGQSREALAVIGANREEAYERGGEPPQLQKAPRTFIGGLDPRAGGTWLGVNDGGLLIAVTNRRDRPVPPQARSRGLLVRDLLGRSSAAEALDAAAAELSGGHFGGCNIVILDPKAGYVVSAANSIRSETIPPGIHALTSGDLDDRGDRRISYAVRKVSELDLSNAEGTARAFQAICSGKSPDAPPMCLHGPEGGTVSSSVIILRAPVWKSEIWHCQGSPDRHSYVNCSHLFCELGRPLTSAVR